MNLLRSVGLEPHPLNVHFHSSFVKNKKRHEDAAFIIRHLHGVIRFLMIDETWNVKGFIPSILKNSLSYFHSDIKIFS